MMERRRKLQQQGGTPNDVVALCKAYSERLKVREERGRGERHAARRSRFATKLPSVFGALFLSFVPHVQQNMLIGCRSFRHQKKTNTPRTRTHTRSCVRFPRVSPHLLPLYPLPVQPGWAKMWTSSNTNIPTHQPLYASNEIAFRVVGPTGPGCEGSRRPFITAVA